VRQLFLGLLVILLVVVVLLMVFPAWRYVALGYVKGEPRKEGLPVGYWVYAAGHDNDKTQAHAVHVLNEMGKEVPPAAVPVLLAALQGANPEARQYAAEALGKLETPPREVVPLLVAALRDENALVGVAAAVALRKLKPEDDTVVPALIEAVRNPAYHRIREAALGALGAFGARAEPAVPLLIEVLQERNTGREAPHMLATLALAEIGPTAYPAVFQALTHEKTRIRLGAVETLREMGPAAKPAVAALTERLQDPDLGVRLEAAYAIWKIDGKAEPGLPILIKALEPGEQGNDLYRTKAVYVLGEIGPEAKVALASLVAMMGHKDWRVREYVADALGKIGPDEEAVKALTVALQDEAPEVQIKAKEALRKVKPQG
jgi:HEAT repeat protein